MAMKLDRQTRFISLIIVCISLYVLAAVIFTDHPIRNVFVPLTGTILKAATLGNHNYSVTNTSISAASNHGANGTETDGDRPAGKEELITCNRSSLTIVGSPLTCGSRTQDAASTGCRIAMGCAVTTRKIQGIAKLKTASPFFKHLLPSFCRTASDGFTYTFIVAYDFDDAILAKSNGREAFSKAFDEIVKALCRKTFTVNLLFLKCNHSKKPAWAQNDALMKGYHDNMDYFYMVNDDTIMETKGWTLAFVKTLAEMTPPNVGLVGPQHRGGNTAILTYNFVHRTHINIFGFFYPRNFTDWYADSWVTNVYRPNNSIKVKNIIVKHTLEIGTRYKVHPMGGSVVSSIVSSTQERLRNTIRAVCDLDVDEQFPKKKPNKKQKS